MKNIANEEFYYHCDIRLPEKFVELFKEAKKDAGDCLPVLIIKDRKGEKYQVISVKEKEIFNKKKLSEIKKINIPEVFLEFLMSEKFKK